MTYLLTLATGKQLEFGYAGEILQYAESEWPSRACKFAPVLLIPTGLDQWQLQGIDMRVLGTVERSEAEGHVTGETHRTQSNGPNSQSIVKATKILDGEILGPATETKWVVMDSLSSLMDSLIGKEIKVRVKR